MALTKNQKEEVLAGLQENLAGDQTIVFVSFKGLTVGETDKFRRQLREDLSQGTDFSVRRIGLMPSQSVLHALLWTY